MKELVLEAADATRVELAPAGREQHRELAHDGRLQDHPAIALGSRVDHHADRVDLVPDDGPGLGGPIGSTIVLGRPLELDDDIFAVDSGGLDRTAEEIVLSAVLDLDIAANESGKNFCAKFHVTLLGFSNTSNRS